MLAEIMSNGEMRSDVSSALHLNLRNVAHGAHYMDEQHRSSYREPSVMRRQAHRGYDDTDQQEERIDAHHHGHQDAPELPHRLLVLEGIFQRGLTRARDGGDGLAIAVQEQAGHEIEGRE